MRISKHHYAEVLVRRGNRVFFLNPPPEQTLPGRRWIQVERSGELAGLSIVEHRLNFPYPLKFHAPRLFRLGMWRHLRAVQAALPPLDIVWSFDISYIYPLWAFPGDTLRILHPVDEPAHRDQRKGARGADVIFSVTREILNGYAGARAGRHFINHGLQEEFLSLVDRDPEPHTGIRVGISGNLLRPDIDREVLLSIIREHPGITFECWGSYEAKQANLGVGQDEAVTRFIQALKGAPNVVLHGAVPTPELAAGYRRMDAFLIAYDVQRDPSHGTNYHKVIEFLATGRVVVSNNITTYAARPDLVQMVEERTHNRGLPGLFRSVLADLSSHNAAPLVRARREFARENSYGRQLDRIENVLADLRR